jgi:hypothetical protein
VKVKEVMIDNQRTHAATMPITAAPDSLSRILSAIEYPVATVYANRLR